MRCAADRTSATADSRLPACRFFADWPANPTRSLCRGPSSRRSYPSLASGYVARRATPGSAASGAGSRAGRANNRSLQNRVTSCRTRVSQTRVRGSATFKEQEAGTVGWSMLEGSDETGRESERSGERRSGRDRRRGDERRGVMRWDPNRKDRRSGRDRRQQLEPD